MRKGVETFLGGLVGRFEVMRDLVDPLADARVARAHHLGWTAQGAEIVGSFFTGIGDIDKGVPWSQQGKPRQG